MTVILKLALAYAGGTEESWTITIKLLEPVALGVPVMLPVEINSRPAGSEPLTVQLKGVTPFDADKVQV